MPAADALLLLRAFCDELARCGVRHACTSPGSRNTPLLLSLAHEPGIETFSHIDERCAGFFALGTAKASGLPVAVTCTSGTAVANLAPAVIEAFQARVPLLVLTADRPPELREVGAGQTIDQLKIFGDAVKWFFEVGVHEATPERVRWMRQLACRAYGRALAEPAGPVHLNFPLREPLIAAEPLPPDPLPGRSGGRPWVSLATAPAPGQPPLALPGRTVVVAGSGAGPAQELADNCAQAGLPLLADPLSGARRGGAAIAHYDLLLRSESFTAAHAPEAVLRLGDLPTSKPLRRWLASLSEVRQIACVGDEPWQDPDAVLIQRQRAAGGLRPQAAAARGWLGSWQRADGAVALAIDEVLGEELSEPLIAARLPKWLPAEATLFVASSMPIRDVEEFAPATAQGPRILANRGANGIDGTVSAAFGAAAASDGPVVLLIGDVALVHDLGGLLAHGRLGITLTIVLLNNDGGGIFHFLPVAEQRDAFERHVATPHGLDFAHAAALYRCAYEQPSTLERFRAALERSLENEQTTIIEVRTERQQNHGLHRRVADAASNALRAGGWGAVSLSSAEDACWR